MIQTRLKGMGVALITPFKEDESVDYDALMRLVDYQLQNNTDFLCVLGTTAETPTLTEEEKKKILNNMKRANAKTITKYVRELALNEGEIIIYNFSELKDSLSETGKYVYELNKIGNNVKIGANAIVTQDLPDNCTVVTKGSCIVRLSGEKVRIDL